MANKLSSGRAQDKRSQQLDSVLIQLTSQRPSDVWRGMDQIRQWLKKDPEDREVYGLLLDAVEKNRDLREQVRNILQTMMQNGSQVAELAVHSLPSGIQDFLADADDAYYAAEYEKAIQIYRQVLRLDPENTRAKDHLAKAILKRDSGESDTDIPRAAQQYFRRARSFIAIRDVVTAMNLLNAAVEAAQAKGMKYPEAEEALNEIQNLVLADEQVSMANEALKKGQRKEAIRYYQNALKLDSTNASIRKNLRNQQYMLNAWWVIPLILAIVGLGLYGLSFLGPMAQSVAPTLTNTASVTKTPFSTETIAMISTTSDLETATSTETVPPPASTTEIPSPVLTETPAFTPTVQILGTGYINKAVASVWTNPNSGLKARLQLNQSLELLEQQAVSNATWYRCRWQSADGQSQEGWILADNITFGPPPTPRT